MATRWIHCNFPCPGCGYAECICNNAAAMSKLAELESDPGPDPDIDPHHRDCDCDECAELSEAIRDEYDHLRVSDGEL